MAVSAAVGRRRPLDARGRAQLLRSLLPALSLVLVLIAIAWMNPRAISYFGFNLMLNLAIPIALATIAQMFVIAGNELASLDGSHGQWSMTLPHNWSNTTVVFNTVCAPTFGGVYIAPEQDVNFTASGEVTLIGVTVDSRGHQSPLQVSAPLNVTNVRIR